MKGRFSQPALTAGGWPVLGFWPRAVLGSSAKRERASIRRIHERGRFVTMHLGDDPPGTENLKLDF
jgi:hypothetical protein